MFKKIIIIVLVITTSVGAWFVYKTYLNKDDQIVKNKLVVATDATYPPLEYYDEKGKLIGFDIDLINAIAKELKSEVEIKNVSFDKIFDALKDGEVDVIISSVTITAEREKTMNFSSPYLNAGQVIVALKESLVSSVNDLIDVKVGVQADTTSQTEAKKYVKKDNLKVYSNYDLALKDLKSKKIEALVIDYPAGVSMVQGGNDQIKIIGKPFTSEFYGIVVSKNNQKLSVDIDSALSKLKKNGALDKLESLWFKR